MERDHDEAIVDLGLASCKLAVSQCALSKDVRSLCPTSCLTTNLADYTKDQDSYITTKYSLPGGCTRKRSECWMPSLAVWCPVTCGGYSSLPTCQCKADWSSTSTALAYGCVGSAVGCASCPGAAPIVLADAYTWCAFFALIAIGQRMAMKGLRTPAGACSKALWARTVRCRSKIRFMGPMAA